MALPLVVVLADRILVKVAEPRTLTVVAVLLLSVPSPLAQHLQALLLLVVLKLPTRAMGLMA
jgi:hypothetical protein